MLKKNMLFQMRPVGIAFETSSLYSPPLLSEKHLTKYERRDTNQHQKALFQIKTDEN